MATFRRLETGDAIRLFGFLALVLVLSTVLCAQAGSGYLIVTVADGFSTGDTSAAFPRAVAVDRLGNVFITDGNRVRKVDSTGTISVVAGTGTQGFSGDGGIAILAELWDASGLAVDAAGNLYIADLNNLRVRKVTREGIITTVAGNGSIGGAVRDGVPATSSALTNPSALTVDSAGNLYIAEGGRIRKVTPGGIISTVAQGVGGDGLGVD